MEKQFMCYQKAHNGLLNVSYCGARDLLLNYLNRNRINYYSEGDHIQLYYRLHNTGFRIRQSIFVGDYTYRCTTSIAGIPSDSAEKQLRLLSWICLENKRLGCQRFLYDYGDKQLQCVNRMSLRPRNDTVNAQYLSEKFDQLIGQAHYLLDIEYAGFLLSVLK
ncbi:MAG: hypothetical protein IJE09_06645 [Oscillospiraceae bacterium]|nr:hypothetical protein [Oscillospiraceae bacterium]